MKKTLLVTLDFYPKIGGVANYYFNLCKNLPPEETVVLTEEIDRNQKSEIRNQEAGEGLRFKILQQKLLQSNIWPHFWPMFGAIKKIIRQEKIEMLWIGDLWPTGLVAWLVRRPYILSVHGRDLLLARASWWKKILVKIILRRAVTVIANSQSTAAIVESFGIMRGKIRVVYPGINQEIKKSRNQEIKAEIIQKHKLKEKRILLSVGRLVERKGFDKVIEAMGDIGEKVEDIVYVIVGDGPDRGRLGQMARIQEHKNTRIKIIFMGQVSDEEKWAWLDLSDVFIMPSRANKVDVEGFGIVYLEAALSGKPVVAGKSGGASEAVVDGETGILVDPENEQEIADAVVNLLKNKELSHRLGEQGKQRAEKYFNWGIAGKKMEEILG